MPQMRESYLGVPDSFHVAASADDDLTELLTMDPYSVMVQANDPAFVECIPEQCDVDFFVSGLDFELPDEFIEGLGQEPLNPVQKFFNERAVPETSRTFPSDYISQSENFINHIYNYGKNLAPQPH
ncbi:unnamed protein product, partial [Gongylonema pulchrum]|uniref:Reverse transcriptase domain-containing protein n=1 Tax=Gongylonema pulchrum TaxID=637853 RepID=A0A183DJX9_9BILA